MAVLFVLPGVLALDALSRPSGSWSRISRSRWRWIGIFLAAPVASLASGSFTPALVVAPFSFFYMARVRSVLDVATGLDGTSIDRRALTSAQKEALAPILLGGLPVLALMGIAFWSGGTKERLVAIALGLPALVAAGYFALRDMKRL